MLDRRKQKNLQQKKKLPKKILVTRENTNTREPLEESPDPFEPVCGRCGGRGKGSTKKQSMPSKYKTVNFYTTGERTITRLSSKESSLPVDPVCGSDEGQASTGGESDLMPGLKKSSQRNPLAFLLLAASHITLTPNCHTPLSSSQIITLLS